MMTNRMQVVKAALYVCVALCLFLFTYEAVNAPLGDGKRMGLRGLKRQRALEQNELWGSVEPLVRWMGLRLSNLVSRDWRESMNQKVAVAGDFLGLLPEEVLSLSIITTLGAAAIGYVAGAVLKLGAILVILFGAFGAVAPYLTIQSSATDRFKNVNRRLPYAIDLLALGMGAGLDFPGAVRQVVEKSGAPDDPMVEEFTLILQGLQVGRTRSQALIDFATRCPTDAVQEFVASVVQAEQRGNPVAQVLRIQAEVSRQRRSVRAEEGAAKAGVAMIGPLVLVFFCILLLILAPMILNIRQSAM